MLVAVAKVNQVVGVQFEIMSPVRKLPKMEQVRQPGCSNILSTPVQTEEKETPLSSTRNKGIINITSQLSI